MSNSLGQTKKQGLTKDYSHRRDGFVNIKYNESQMVKSQLSCESKMEIEKRVTSPRWG